MNSASRCGRNEVSTLSSARRSAVSRRAVELAAAAGELKPSSQCALPAVFVGQQLADAGNGGPVSRRDNDAGVAVVIPDELAAAAARGHDGDGLVRLLRLGMAYSDNGLDACLARLRYRAPERHRLRANRHAAKI